MQTILTCIDFSDTSTPVMDQTEKLAEAIGARVVLLHVDQPQAEYMGLDVGYVDTSVGNEDLPIEQRPSYQKLQESARQLEGAGIEVETVYDEGLAVECILDHAKQKQATMVVLGSHGHGALYHLMMGSITEGVLRHAEDPVLVVPAPRKEKSKKATKQKNRKTENQEAEEN